jgi:phosphoribosylamine--glycine ligase
VPVSVEELPALVKFARKWGIDLTVVGPEAPLADGLVDTFRAAGLTVFGPGQEAAQLESSKAFAKDFMRRHGIPTGDYAVFEAVEPARAYLDRIAHPVVVKADGLAAGKGVLICDDRAQAQAALDMVMVRRTFGGAGDRVVIEERLAGPEISILAWCDGRTVRPILPARDHKRIFDGDQGPNTGGMGAYAPAPDIEAGFIAEVQRTVLQPTIVGMAAEGRPYVGILYAGLMLTTAGPKVLEFNCRFGDPETQAVLPLLDSDIYEIFMACLEGRLDQSEIRWRPGFCASIVLASPGYPGDYPKGLVMSGLEDVGRLDDVVVFHAGTAEKAGQIVTAGGRVLAVSAVGPDLAMALARAYEGVAQISFEGAQYRRDIGRGYG